MSLPAAPGNELGEIILFTVSFGSALSIYLQFHQSNEKKRNEEKYVSSYLVVLLLLNLCLMCLPAGTGKLEGNNYACVCVCTI
jgi:hypothetical protein